MRSFLAVCVLVPLLSFILMRCDSGGADGAKNPQDALYVCNQAGATVSIIDTGSNEVVETVDLTEKGFSSNAKPHHVVVEPDASAWYLSLIGADLVVKFNAKNQVVGRADFGAPGMLSLHPTEDVLYAGHTMSLKNVPSTIAVIRRSDMSRVEIVSVGISRPHGMKVRPTGDFAYSTSLSTNEIVAIDAESRGLTRTTLPGSRQRYVQMDISSDGSRAYVTGQVAGQVQVLNLSDPTTPTIVDSVDVGAEPWHPQLSADGETLYFGSKGADAVYALETQSLDTTSIRGKGLANPHGSAHSPDGKTLYISNTNVNGRYESASGEEVGTVVVIDTEDDEIKTVIEVGDEPAGINTRWQP